MNTCLESLPNEIARKRLLGIGPAAEFVGRSVPEIRRLVRLGLFPKPFKLNGRLLSWQVGELADWIDSKVGERSAA
jgi:predicted DNA-binding transcriptional regulator AlpA